MHSIMTRDVADTYDAHEAKTFFDKNYSLIYYIFHDVFTSVETDLRQRGRLTVCWRIFLKIQKMPETAWSHSIKKI